MTASEAMVLLKNEYLGDSELMKQAKFTAVEALEKQIPTKVTHEATLYKSCTCPHCKNVVDKFEKFGDTKVRVRYEYCCLCGQKLDWSVEF